MQEWHVGYKPVDIAPLTEYETEVRYREDQEELNYELERSVDHAL